MTAQKFVILTRNIKVQRPNILSWTSSFRTSVVDLICDGKNMNDNYEMEKEYDFSGGGCYS
ncbi:MAG: hypothetical protein JRF06_07265 [Deltaproteobacteria bacterium]|nr:hypothetical protein [Deltaproteobacteria bacterium]